MNHPSQEDLLGYVLGALDAQEQREVQQLIDADPELEEQLLELKASLMPLDFLEGAKGPRPGLARRTSEMVAGYQKQLEQEKLARQQREQEQSANQSAHPITDKVFADAMNELEPQPKKEVDLAFSESFRERSSLHLSSWSLSDMLVGFAAVAVLAAVLLPAVSYSRFNSRIVACQSNLRSLGTALLTFSNTNQMGEFPQIPSDGNLAVSGSYAPLLKDAGLIADDSEVLCMGRYETEKAFQIPSCEQVNAASGEKLEHFKRVMGGDYGYSFGYIEDGRYRCPNNRGRADFVLLSDMPSQSLEGRRSANHGGYGQNCLFEDGHIEFVRGHAYGEDLIYVNDQGIVAPGVDPSDSVIAPSHLAPIVFLAD